VFGSGDIEKSISLIRGTEEGSRILNYLESDEHIMSVTLTTGGGDLGSTVISTMSKIVGEKPSWWEFWKSPTRIDISIVQTKINMNVSDPSLIAVDGSKFNPSLTRIVAHELGHAYNFSRHGSGNYRHNSIKIENTIMQQLDPNSTVRHQSLGHGGIGSQF